MKKYFYLIVLIFFFYFAFGMVNKIVSANISSDAIGDTITVTAYTEGDIPTGTAVISIPFTVDFSELVTVTVSLDVNGNGIFTKEEIAVDHVPSVALTEFPVIYPLLLSEKKIFKFINQTSPVLAKVVIKVSGEKIKKQVSVTKAMFEVSDFFTSTPSGFTGMSGYEKFKQALNAMTMDTVLAADPPAGSIYNPGMPDNAGRKGHPNECFPVAASNSIQWLAQQHNLTNQLPATTDHLLDQIDQCVGYNPTSGTSDNNMVSGKDSFAQSTGLPLENQKIDNAMVDGASDLFGKIKKALKEGKDVELIIKRKTSATGTSDLGHAVTVVGAYTKDKKNYIIIHDVLTPNGNDTYEVGRNGKVKGYKAISGDVFVDFIITEAIKT